MKKKVLVIDEWLPYPLDCGKKIRTFNLLKYLSDFFEITLMCYCNSGDIYIKEFEMIGIKVVCIKDRRLKKWTIPFYFRVIINFFENVPFTTVYHFCREFKKSITNFITNENPDVVHCEWTNLAPLLDGCDLNKIIISSHNIESDIWFRLAKQSFNPLKKILAFNQAQKIEKLERFWYSRVAFCTSVSKNDSEIIESYGGRPFIVENGVDIELYSNVETGGVGDKIVFTASYDTFSNQDAAHFFINDHWQRIKQRVPGIQLIFVGKCPTERMKQAAMRDSSIHLTGWVSDVKPFIRTAKVCIVPLRIGGGSRLKIFEAMAMKKAIVSTKIGAEGIDVVDGRELILRDNPGDFSNAVVECCFNEKKRQQLSENAYDFVKNRYDWSVLAEKQKIVWKKISG